MIEKSPYYLPFLGTTSSMQFAITFACYLPKPIEAAAASPDFSSQLLRYSQKAKL